MMEWSRTWQFAIPIDRVWTAFIDRSTSTPWNHVFTGDPYYGRGAIVVTEVQRRDTGDERHLTWTETEGDDLATMSVTVADAGAGARLTLTRATSTATGTLRNRHGGRFQGWVESMYDFAVHLERGIPPVRHIGGDGFRRLGRIGADLIETAGGVEIGAVHDGLAREAGMEPGDLLLRVEDAAVFTLSDLWLVQRLLRAGEPVRIAYLRGNEVREGFATVPG
ncbi:MAG: hypothetical protein AMXMBFR23_22530 [Chloroflexota bacterium]